MLDIVLGLSALILFILGFIVYYSNPKSRTNLNLTFFISAGFLWVVANLLANINLDSSQSNTLLFTRLTLVGAAILPLTYVLFAHAFTGIDQNLSDKRKFIYFLPVMLILTTTFSDHNAKAEGSEIVLGQVYFFMLPIFILYYMYGTYLLVKAYKHAKSIQKLQYQYVFLGILFSVVPGLVLNAILPLAGYIETAYFGPSIVIFFAAFTSIAIIRHQLLNVRLVIARSLAYLLSIGILTIGYGLTSSLVINKVFSNQDDFWSSTVASALVLIVAVLSYQPIKNFFDRVTNRIFYRDAYDPQQFLDELNNTVVENIEVGILLRHSTGVIQENIKSQFCYVEIKATADTKERLIGVGDFNLSERDNKILKEELVNTGKRTVITDDLGSENSKLKDVLYKNNIAILMRLMPGSDMSKESLYYLIIGNKKSGNIYSSQDIRILEIIADELLIAIQNSLRFEEIQQFNVTLQQKVNDATEKLQRTNKKLREMDETKDEFISMASHQLRTPLTSVKGYLSMVLDGDAGKLKGNQKELLDQAFVSSQRMVYLIADLLNVSRLKTGKFIIDPSPTNLAKVIESEISQLKEVAKGKKVTLTYNKPANFPQLMLDETKIRQVIMNFVDNAIYYTPNGGKVTVEVKEDKSNVYFTVKDDGIGIPQSEQSQLFTKFYRASNARKARPDGTGLGLFMAKKVVNAQGGEVLFESKEGKGSIFGFTFKKSKLEGEQKPETNAGTVAS